MRLTLLAFLLIVITNLHAQKAYLLQTKKAFTKNYAKVDSMLYANKYEITNYEYREFMGDLLSKGKLDDYKIAIIDSTGWRCKHAYNEPYVELYYRHPAYQSYPLVNVSYEGAILYCNWLTLIYNSDSKRKFKKVIFRLPSKDEWEIAARGGLIGSDYPWGGYSLIGKSGAYRCNYMCIGDEAISYDTISKTCIVKNVGSSGMGWKMNDRAEITAPVTYYCPNDFGLFNISGNVSEMINEKGIAKGGSWISPGYDVRIESEEFYSHSSNHIGFRVFMEVLEN
jgi:formylglycine-generating enzyme required for sulfatase activity